MAQSEGQASRSLDELIHEATSSSAEVLLDQPRQASGADTHVHTHGVQSLRGLDGAEVYVTNRDCGDPDHGQDFLFRPFDCRQLENELIGKASSIHPVSLVS